MQQGTFPVDGNAYAFPPQYMPPTGQDAQKVEKRHDEMINQGPHYQDVWAAVFFWLNYAIFLVLVGYCVKACGEGNLLSKVILFIKEWNINAPEEGTMYKIQMCIWAGLSILGVALASTIVLVACIFAYPLAMLRIGFVGATILPLICTVVVFGMGDAVPQGFLISGPAFSVLVLLVLYFVWERIPVAAVMLRHTIDVFKRYPASWAVLAFGTIFSGINTIFFCIIAVSFPEDGALYYYSPAAKFGIGTYALFSWFWAIATSNNVIQTTVAGVVATHYFFGTAHSAPPSPTRFALRRAMTYSFGSIAFGSLIIAVIQTMEHILRAIKHSNKVKDKKLGAVILIAFATCLLHMIKDIAILFNYYAFTYIAIYGGSYLGSAKSVFRLLKTTGVKALINDDILNGCLCMCAVLCGTFCATVVLLARQFFEFEAIYILVSSLSALVVGCLVFFQATKILAHGNRATYVCYAEDPEALQRTKPKLYEELQRLNDAHKATKVASFV